MVHDVDGPIIDDTHHCSRCTGASLASSVVCPSTSEWILAVPRATRHLQRPPRAKNIASIGLRVAMAFPDDGSWELPFGEGSASSGSSGEEDDEGGELGGSLVGARGPSRALAGGRDCERCLRPLKTCLCPHLPATPLAIRTTVVVLQHPAEKKRRLQTARLGRLVVGGPGGPGTFHLVQGRRVMRDAHRDLLPPSFWEDVEQGRVVILFPGSGAASLESFDPGMGVLGTHACGGEPDGSATAAMPIDRLTLLVIDGTWKQAKEMFREIQQNPHLGSKLRQVSFPPQDPPKEQEEGDDEQQQGRGVLRKQPVKGCVTTLEAIAFALFYLERTLSGGNEAHAETVRSALLRPLEAMVQMQVHHGASCAPRTYGEDSKLARTLMPPPK